MKLHIIATLCIVLAGCAAPDALAPQAQAQPEPYKCLLPGEQRMLVAELFFGRDIPGRAPLTDAEWSEFAALTVTPNFPDGFTVFDGDGQWQNPTTGRIARERTKILLVAAKRQPDLAPRLQAVIGGYKARFHQQSVGVITRDSCAAF
ncbi:MAG TPA: DUF3574 domain-containing protein [Stellaceae bacterium]|nr:DUF3574 domain-containing protein [Stellaceae bacterium]